MIARISMSLGLLGAWLLAGCAPDPEEPAPAPRTARAVLQPAPGEDISGEVLFEETDQGVRIRAVVNGLPPGEHGFHVHEHGVCEPPDFTSAGEHFNPDGNPHGPPGPDTHAGDFGNIEAFTGDVAAEKIMTSQDITLQEEGLDSIIGRAVIVHADRDDLVSQPSGDAGARLACGVVELIQP